MSTDLVVALVYILVGIAIPVTFRWTARKRMPLMLLVLIAIIWPGFLIVWLWEVDV